LTYVANDRAEHVWRQARDGFHQAGTTRMSAEPADGVVDPQCRVHRVHNLYVASSSNFVTSGQANSTFSAVAFALRMVDHLQSTSR
jgi:choline dehydrogenase-like flavoprotein